MQQIEKNQSITFTYTNWRGETAERQCIVQEILYGETEYHPTPQFLLKGFDKDKGSVRIYALADMKNLKIAPIPTMSELVATYHPELQGFLTSEQYLLADKLLKLQMSTDWGQGGMATMLNMPLSDYLKYEYGTLSYSVTEYEQLIERASALIERNKVHQF